MNSQLKTKLKISTTCKHTDLLYVSATALSLSIYKTLYHSLSLSVCYSNLTKTLKIQSPQPPQQSNYQTIKQQQQTNKQQLSYLINYRPLFATTNWTTTTTSCYNQLQLLLLPTLQVGYTMRDIRYFWRDGLSSVGMSSEVELPQFRVLGHRQRATEINLTTGTPIH